MSLFIADAGNASVPRALAVHSRLLWWIAIAFYGVGDTVTTILGVWAGRGVEAGPVVAVAMEAYGFPGLLVVKIASLLGFYLVWNRIRSPGRVGIPLALSVVGVGVTGWNGVVMLLAPP